MKSTCLTGDELELYHNDQLSQQEKHRVEQHLVDCALCSEALAGFAVVPITGGAIADLNSRIDALTQPSGFWATNKSWIIGSSGVIVAAAAIIIAMNWNNPNDPVITTPPVIAENHPPETMPEEELVVTEEEIDNAELIAEEELITYEKTLENQPATTDEKPLAEAPLEVQPEPAQPEATPIDTMTMHPTEVDEAAAIEVETSKTVKSNVNITYMVDLKVVDYSDFYTDDIKEVKQELSGTPANQENKHTEVNAGTISFGLETIYIPYEEYLERVMKKFNKNHFKAAIKEYRIIIDHFPDDINAHFYGGLCYYNIGKSKKAIQYFDKVLNNYINTFDQEAMWYKALALMQKGNDDEAREVMHTIVNNNGFYAERARKKLAELR